MYLSSLSTVAALSLCLPNVTAAPHSHPLTRQDGGSLTYDNSAEPFTFHYTTSQPNETNYIGLWAAAGGGPIEGVLPVLAKASLRWKLAPEADGTVHLGPEQLEPGEYTAFFLVNPVDPQQPAQYLADPVNITFEGLPADLSFPVKHATLHNARENEAYNATVEGMVLGRGNERVTFEKLSGDAWIQVSALGIISGTPSEACSHVSEVEIRATADNGSSASIRLNIPVRGVSQPLIDELAVMSYNLWVGGASVRNYHEKQLRFILSSDVDVIGVQEAADGAAMFVGGESHVGRLGKALGWYSWSSNYSAGILSRYPIVEEHGQVESYSGGVRINLNGKAEDVKEVNVWNMHTYPFPYGSDSFCYENASKDEVLAAEMQARGTNMTALVAKMQKQLDNSATVPVLLTGDMNAPSHLDWIEELKEKNCGISDFPWPTSKIPIDAGLIDSYRVAHPNVTQEQGITWSPINKVDPITKRKTPQDRIDFVYATKELDVLSSETVLTGEPKVIPNERDNEWTSDHRAVLTRFLLP